MSNRENNLRTVAAIYAAFGRGDIPAILSHLAEDVDWETGNYPDSGVPWLRAGRGVAAVARFFEALGAVEMQHFEPLRLLADDQMVVAVCNVRLRVKATGKTVSEAFEPHLWTFGPDGRVVAFRHAADTAQHLAAFTG